MPVAGEKDVDLSEKCRTPGDDSAARSPALERRRKMNWTVGERELRQGANL
jgi:hypothetical protein